MIFNAEGTGIVARLNVSIETIWIQIAKAKCTPLSPFTLLSATGFQGQS